LFEPFDSLWVSFPGACRGFVIPAKVPRQARDPEFFDVAQDPEGLEGLVERAGIQKNQTGFSRIKYGAGCVKRGITVKERR
jgi:hypothetical protein